MPPVAVSLPPALAAFWPEQRLSDSLPLPLPVGGSNNWVVHGSRTDTGAPLLANDMHLDVRIPSVWYEMHLSGKDFDVIGLSLPSVPLIIAGHNRDVAWGITFAYTDTQDIFLERMHPNRPDQYLYQGQWKTAERISESIRVKGRDTPVVHEILQTIHGPIISPLVPYSQSEYALALRWSAHDPGGLIMPLLRMNAASNLSQFKAAAAKWSDPPINLVCADRNGDIGYLLAGRIPMRPQGHGIGPFAGWDGQNDWIGYVPKEEKPWLVNPQEGFVATANNRVAATDYPHYLSEDYLPPYRAERIRQVLAASAKVSKNEFAVLQGDYQCLQAAQFIEALAPMKVHAPLAKDLLDRLRGWDQTLGPQSQAGAIYEFSSTG
jgi:penicillin amidase